MKVLMVSQAGKVADVTLQSSCTCSDEAALKVSTSCTSVYLDGSEVRGSENATISALYGQRSGKASFTVWMPEFPLEIHVEDSKLSHIKGWKAPRLQSNHLFKYKSSSQVFHGETNGENDGVCSIVFQQSQIQVYGRFVAVDDNSGRESYLLSRKASLRLTEIVSHLLRVSDTTVASLAKTIVKGMSVGRTEVQVLSPITGRVIGSKDLRVSTEKVWIKQLHATIISGLTLSLQPDLQMKEGFDAISTFTPTLTAKYQEGLIDIWLEFSDGTTTALRKLRPETFTLKVKSLKPSVVAVAPSPLQAQPRVIAIGHGQGDFLQVSVQLSKSCGIFQPTLATTMVRVNVDLGSEEIANVHFGDEHHAYPREMSKEHNNYLVEKPIADAAIPYSSYSNPEISRQPEVQARMHPSVPSRVTGLEVGMYVLLAIFGIAVVVFAGSCIIYSYKGVGIPLNNNYSLGRRGSESSDSIANAHDWVWLGKATLERASGVGIKVGKNGLSEGLLPLNDMKGNDNGQTSSWRDYHRFCKSKETNGFIPQINITTNPGSELLEPLLNTEDDASPPIGFSSATFTRPAAKGYRRVTFNNLGNKPPEACWNNDDLRTVRQNSKPNASNILQQSRLFSDSRGENCSPLPPPPIPPHGVNVITNPFDIPCAQQVTIDRVRGCRTEPHSGDQSPMIVQQSEEDDLDISATKFIEVNGDDFVRLRGVTRDRAAQIKRATIMENPLLSAAIPKTVDINEHLDNLPPTLDYDHLLEYFNNLKESNA